MRDKFVIYYDSPCVSRPSDPGVQTSEAAQSSGITTCPFYPERRECSPPEQACVDLAGSAMARNVLQFYGEASEQTLAMERDEFRERAPLPPDTVKAYVQPKNGELERITDPDEVVERVWEYARAVLDLQPGERVARGADQKWAPAQRAETEEAGTPGPSA